MRRTLIGMVAVVAMLSSLVSPGGAAQYDGATKKSLMIQIPGTSPGAVSEWIQHICTQHRDPSQDDYIYNLVIRDVGTATEGPEDVWSVNLFENHLEIILPHVPGGSGEQCFDNVFVGPVELTPQTVAKQWKNEPDFPTGLQDWCADSPYCGGIRTGEWRWDNINATRAVVDSFLQWVNTHQPGVRSNLHWYVTYEAMLDWLGDNGYSNDIRAAYEAYLLETVRQFRNALIAAGEPVNSSSRAVMWSPRFEGNLGDHSASQQNTIRANLRSLFNNVQDLAAAEGIARAVDWVHFQDGIGQSSPSCYSTACYSEVKNWYNFLASVNYWAFSFASLRVNMEYFRTPLSDGYLWEHIARENYYEANGVPVGASFSMRYWRHTHQELAET